MGKAEKSNNPRIRKGARKGWQGFVKRPNTDDQKTAQNTFIEYIDLILLVPFRILGLFCWWTCWPFGETTIIHDMVEASGLPWPKEVTWLLWGGLELFAFWKRWPSKGDSKTILSLISKDVEMKSMEDEMAVQKRKFEIILKGKDDEIDGGQKRLKTIEGERINFQKNLKQKDNDISKLKEENNQLVKELCDVREQINNAEAKIKQRDEEIHHLQMKQTELASTLKLTESERLNFCNDLQTARKQLHDTEKKLFDTEKKQFEVREQKMEAEAEKHDALRRSGEMLSDIFFDKNPDIVHLSDENRPTKLAEMFRELYDNEWTAAYTVMEDEQFQKRHIIDFLLGVVMESYVFCKNEVDTSWNVVSKWFLDDKYTSYIKSICRHEPLKKLLSSEDIRKYMALCLKLTLLMNANDPPVYLECSVWKPIRVRDEDDDSENKCEREISNEETAAATRMKFDEDRYTEYTTKGRYTEFQVWPVMYLYKGGPMLAKGIAQGVNSSNAESSDKLLAWWT